MTKNRVQIRTVIVSQSDLIKSIKAHSINFIITIAVRVKHDSLSAWRKHRITIISIFIVGVFFSDVALFSKQWFFFFIFFFLLSASHGILDAFTNGGLGIALLSPFDNTRYFFPWTPIIVSPLGMRGLLSNWGLMVIKCELLWIWLPSFLIVIFSSLARIVAAR